MEIRVLTEKRQPDTPGTARKKPDQVVDTVLEGDPDFFFWLVNAAGTAQNRIDGSYVELEGGGRLVLRPSSPIKADSIHGGAIQGAMTARAAGQA